MQEAEKIHSAIVQFLADTSEYFLEDIPKSKEEVLEIIDEIGKEPYDVDITHPSDEVVDKTYALFLEDWERERKDTAGFDRDEEWPDPSELPEDIIIEDAYPDFEAWKKVKTIKTFEAAKKETAEQSMSLHDFLSILKQEIIKELSKIDDIGLNDEQKRYLGIKKSFMGTNQIQISRGLDLRGMPYTIPEIKIDEDYFSKDKNGLQELEEFLNSELKFTHFDDFEGRAEGLDKPLYEKIKGLYKQTGFRPINLPDIKENWLKIKEYNERKEKEKQERIKNYVGPYEGKRRRDEKNKIRYAKNREELIKKLEKKKEK